MQHTTLNLTNHFLPLRNPPCYDQIAAKQRDFFNVKRE